VSQMNGAGHPSDTIAALLTASELRQRSGRELITATVLAYEVYCKIGDVFDYLGHGIDHTTVTGMGAVVGAGKLLGLTPEEMVHAIGITVGGNTATRQGRADSGGRLPQGDLFSAARWERDDGPEQCLRGALRVLQGHEPQAGCATTAR